MDSQAIEDIRRGQLNIVASQARSEGTMEGMKLAIEAITATLASVADVHSKIAAIEERDRHADPQIAIVRAALENCMRRLDDQERTQTRQWIEGLIRVSIAALVGSGGTMLVNLLRH